MAVPPLQVLQHWMQAALLHSRGTDASAPPSAAALPQDTPQFLIEDVLTRSRQMSAAERLAIYTRAYFARLLECLQSEFPAVRHAAGDEAFAGLAWGYLHARPSSSYTLSQLGRYFADYLQETRPAPDAGNSPPDFAEMLIELARLERTYAEVFDAPGPENGPRLGPAELAGLSPQQFAESRLTFHQTVRLLTLQFPGHEYCSAIRQGREPAPISPETTRLVILRRDYVVRRFTVSSLQYDLLAGLQRGETVGQVLAAAAHDSPSLLTLSGDLRQWFREWTAAGLFRELVRPRESE